MRFIWIAALKDLRRLRREPVTLLTWLGIPTFTAVILTLIFGPGQTRPHGTLLIVDEDGRFGATLISSAFSQGDLGKMITVEKVARDEGRRRIDKGDASALLIIPAGFTTALLESKPVRLELVRNPAQQILPGMIEETVSMLADGAFYIQAVAGEQLRGFAVPNRPSDLQIAAMAVQSSTLGRRLQKYLLPPLIQLDTQIIQTKMERTGGFAVMLLPGVLYMGLFFLNRALSSDIWNEKLSGTIRRLIATPAQLGAFLAGKLIAAMIVLAAVGAIALLVGHFLLDLDITHLGVAVLWISLTGAAMYLLLLILQTLASTERMANLLTNMVILPLAMLGGGFVPFDWMPQNLARIGRLTPNGWAVTHLQSMIGGSTEPLVFAIVAAIAVAAWLGAIWRVRRIAC
jgi:ABC-type multidrug transport system permease subunit